MPVGDQSRVLDGEEIDHLGHTLRREEPGDKHRRIRQVHLLGHVRAPGREGKAASAFVVEKGGEHGGRIETGVAIKIDRSVGRHQCGRL